MGGKSVSSNITGGEITFLVISEAKLKLKESDIHLLTLCLSQHVKKVESGVFRDYGQIIRHVFMRHKKQSGW